MFGHVVNLHGVGGHAPGRSPVAGVLCVAWMRSTP